MARKKSDADLLLNSGTIVNALLMDAGAALPEGAGAHSGIVNAKIAPMTLELNRVSNDFISAFKRTELRQVYIQAGNAAIDPASSVIDLAAQLGATAVSAAAPVYDEATRTWSNLGAAVYPAMNKMVVKDADGRDDVILAGGELVIARLENAGTFAARLFKVNGAGVETELAQAEVDALPSLTLYFRQWVDGTSSLLQEAGVQAFANAAGVDATERANIDQIVADLGLVLDGSGQYNLPAEYAGKTFRGRFEDHLAGLADKHQIDVILGAAGLDVAGIVDPTTKSLLEILNKLQDNIDAASSGGSTELSTYFNELRSNGILGSAIALTSAGPNSVQVPAGRIAYVQGKRFVLPVLNDAPASNSTVFYWVDNAGSVQQGAAYPADEDTIAKIGKAEVSPTGDVTLTAEHRPLLELDQKVYDVETAIANHVAQAAGAHAASAISITEAQRTDVGAEAATVSSALTKLMARIRSFEQGKNWTVVRGQAVDGQTEIALPAGVTVPAGGEDGVFLMIDGRKQELTENFTVKGDGTGIVLTFAMRATERFELMAPKAIA